MWRYSKRLARVSGTTGEATIEHIILAAMIGLAVGAGLLALLTPLHRVGDGLTVRIPGVSIGP